MWVSRRRAVLCSALALAVLVPASPARGADAPPQVVRFHGGGIDRAEAVAVDSAGNVFLAGALDTPGTAVTFGVVMLDPRGELVWRRAYGGSRGGVGGAARALALDAAGNVYAAGSISDGAIFGADIDALVVKFGPDGTERWAQRYSGAGSRDDATEIAVGRSGEVYVSGTGTGAGTDWVTRRFAADGTAQWTRRLSGPGSAEDEVGDLALTPDGNVVVAGNTRNLADGVTSDLEVVVYDPLGAVVWQRRWTDTPASHEQVRDLDVGADGRIVVTGSTAQNASPEFGVPLPVTVRLDAAGTLQQVMRAGGGAVDVDAGGRTFVAGTFETPGASAAAMFDANGNPVWSTPLTAGDGASVFVTALAVDRQGIATVAGIITNASTLDRDYLTIRYAADGRELWRHRFNGAGGGEDRVTGLAVDATDAALVAGTSWGGFRFDGGGTDHDMVALRFPAGATPPGEPPAALAAPTQLSAASPARAQVRLRWQDNSATETGFRVERCRGAGCTSFAQVAVLGAGATTYLDAGLTRNTSYTYRVLAFDAAGTSPFSNPATARTR